MNEDRWIFYALAVATVLGLVFSLSYAWLINPIELTNTTPDILRSDYMHEWIRLAALGYAADGDLERAEMRLASVPRTEIQAALSTLIENYVAQGRPAPTIRSLSHLADELGIYTPAMDAYLSAPAPATPLPAPSPTPQVTSPSTSTPTPIPPPTHSPLPTPVPSPYRVVSRTLVCDGGASQLQVLVRAVSPEEESEEEEQPPEPTSLPGIVLWLTWPNGASRAVTGLRPEIDPGYADFDLEPGTLYALSVDEPNAPILSGLEVETCADGEGSLGTWRVILEINLEER
jgi:hypothetical protein